MAIKRCNVPTNTIKRELKEHGTSDFPIGLYNDYLPMDDIPWHWHEQLELAYVEKGQLYLGVNADKIPVKAGEALFVNKEILHSCWCENGDSCTIESIVFRAELMGAQNTVFYREYMQHLIENSDYPYFILRPGEKWQEEALSLHKRIWRAATNEEFGYEFSIRSDMSRIMLALMKHMSKKPKELSEKTMRTERRMKVMLSYIADNYGNELKNSDIAQSAAVSESECVRCFHDSVGISPMKYVKQLRIQNAAELLLETDRSIGDIASQCGFQDISYFTKSFREAKGKTPKEYRKQKNIVDPG